MVIKIKDVVVTVKSAENGYKDVVVTIQSADVSNIRQLDNCIYV